MSASMSNEIRAEPNLTPLLDIVFQLITFFMLVINFSQDNFDARIKLPVAGSARPQDDVAKLHDERLVLNIDHEGHLIFSGRVLSADEAVQQIRLELRSPARTSKLFEARSSLARRLPQRVIIRADATLPLWRSTP